jgi:tripartite-type tricarboxylate transporter receptor subunit TctC
MRKHAMRSVFRFALVSAVVAACAIAAPACAQDYPSRTVRIVVAYAPGGSTDLVARILSDELSRGLGQRFIVDNKPGGGTIVGTETVAHATPDGHTLFYGTNAMVINSALHEKLPYDPIKDFEPVSLTAVQSLGILVNPRLNLGSVQSLVAYAKANPGKLNFASSGNGSAQHLAGELLRNLAAINIVHIPYKGAGPALTDLLGGNVDMMITSLLGIVDHVKSGRLRLIATTGPQRSAATPDVPTVAESGVPGYRIISWQAVFAPAGTSKAVVERLNAELRRIASVKKVTEKLFENGLEYKPGSSAELRDMLIAEQKQYIEIVRRTGAKTE